MQKNINKKILNKNLTLKKILFLFYEPFYIFYIITSYISRINTKKKLSQNPINLNFINIVIILL